MRYQVVTVQKLLDILYFAKIKIKAHFKIINISTDVLENANFQSTLFFLGFNKCPMYLNSSTSVKYLRLSKRNFVVVYIIPFFILYILVVLCRHSITGNVLGLCVRAGFRSRNVQLKYKFQ